jgi:tRNA threonylcarbamoyladenosine modification (KEOPS) complex  Pcc1 subunit
MDRYTAKIVLPKMTKSSYRVLLGVQRKQKRSSIKIKEGASRVIVEVEADDATALRASLNTLIRDIQVIEAAKQVSESKVPQNSTQANV